jgi:glycosyltransferase involved in cell wall biosynthesis
MFLQSKTRVLHLLSSDRFSGAENVACQIIEMMKGMDFEMAYCSPDGQIREALAGRSVLFYPVKKMNISEARRVVRAFGPDIIHAHDARASAVATVAGGDARIISHMHVNNEKMKKTNARTLAYLACSLKFEKILWVSKSSLEGNRFFRQLSPISTVLYNVLDPGPVLTKAAGEDANGRYDVVFIGRMTAQKDPARLIRVLRLAADRIPGLRAAVIGEGELLEPTKAMAARTGLLKNVSFFGVYGKSPAHPQQGEADGDDLPI